MLNPHEIGLNKSLGLPQEKGKYEFRQSWWETSLIVPIMERKRWRLCLKIHMRHNLQGVFFTTGYIWLGHLCLWTHKASPLPPVVHNQFTEGAFTSKTCRLRSTIAEVITGSIYNADWFCVRPVVTLSVTQVRSWWITSHSTWSPSGRGGSFQTWSQATWRSFSPSRRLQSLRTGRASSKTLRKSSCQG